MSVIEKRSTLSLEKIMYAADSSLIAHRAGEYAKGLARRFGSKVDIAHVFAVSDGLEGDATKAERFARRQCLTQQEADFRSAGIDAHARGSSECPVPDALVLLERQLGPDLMVVGTHSKSSLDRLLIGSTAEYLIRNARCPILTIGPNAKQPAEGPIKLERIVFATDFTEASNRAGGVALAFAQAEAAHLWICHVMNSKQSVSALPNSIERDFRSELERLIPREAYDWCRPGSATQNGNAARAILELAERVKADLIVMGARGRSFWLSHLHRGVTQDVLAEATCPVLTVR